MSPNFLNTQFFIAGLSTLITALSFCTTIAAQEADSSNNISTLVLKDSVNTSAISKKEQLSEVVKMMVAQQRYATLSYTDNKVKIKIAMDSPLYKLPGGESRAVVVALPNYKCSYILRICSMVHGLGFNLRLFSPTAILLDSAFKPERLLKHDEFRLKDYEDYGKNIRLEAQVIIDGYRDQYKYLLVYTIDNGVKRIGTYINRIEHPVIRSEDGKISVEVHRN